MKCINCNSEMKCVDDVNQETVRIDWVECEKCSSTAEIHYGNRGEYIIQLLWKR